MVARFSRGSKRFVGLFALALVLTAGIHAAEEEPAPAEAPAEARAKPAPGVEWELDRIHSTVGFKVRHLGVSYVTGRFTDFDARIMADPRSGRLFEVEGTIRTASVDTGVTGRDDHLRGDDFFAVDRFPEMKLVTRRIRWSGRTFTAVADLTIRGVTHMVRVSGELLGARRVDMGKGRTWRAGYSATFRINRQEFGLAFNKVADGLSVVGNEVIVQLEIEASRAP